MVLNKEYNPEMEDDDWSVVSEGTGAEMVNELDGETKEEEEMNAASTTREGADSQELVAHPAPTFAEIPQQIEQDKSPEVMEAENEDGAMAAKPTNPAETVAMTNKEGQTEPEETPLLASTTSSSPTINSEKSEGSSMPNTKNEEREEESPPNETTNTNTNPRPNSTQDAAGDWFRKSLTNLGTRLQEMDQKHNLQQKARSSIQQVEASLKEVEKAVDETSHRFAQKLAESDLPAKFEDKTKQAAQVLQTQAQVVGQKLQTGATKAKAMSEHVPVAQMVAGAAVVATGAVLLARGKPAAGAAVWATGGAAVAAAEVARQQNRPFYSDGLNEELHLD